MQYNSSKKPGACRHLSFSKKLVLSNFIENNFLGRKIN